MVDKCLWGQIEEAYYDEADEESDDVIDNEMTKHAGAFDMSLMTGSNTNFTSGMM